MGTAHKGEGKKERYRPGDDDGYDAKHCDIEDLTAASSEDTAIEEHATQFYETQRQNLHQLCGPEDLLQVSQSHGSQTFLRACHLSCYRLFATTCRHGQFYTGCFRRWIANCLEIGT